MPSEMVDVDNGLSEGLRRFLWQIVADAARDEPVVILAREFPAIGRWIRGVWGTIRIAFESNCGHGNGRKLGELLFEVVVLGFAFSQSDPPAIVVYNDGDMIRIVEGCCGAIKCGIIEVPLWRSNLPNELRKIAAVFVVAGTATLRREVVLVPPLEFHLRRQWLLVGCRAGDQIAAH